MRFAKLEKSSPNGEISPHLVTLNSNPRPLQPVEVGEISAFGPFPEFDSSQLVAEPVLRQGSSVPGGARQGKLLADRPRVRAQVGGAGLPAAAAARSSLLPDSIHFIKVIVHSTI